MSLVFNSEWEEFRSIVDRAGLRNNDFDCREMEDHSRGRIHEVTGLVTITRKSTGQTRQYECGFGRAWLGAFQHELQSGRFD